MPFQAVAGGPVPARKKKKKKKCTRVRAEKFSPDSERIHSPRVSGVNWRATRLSNSIQYFRASLNGGAIRLMEKAAERETKKRDSFL